MTFNTWISPLLDFYIFDREILTHHIAQAHDGRFELRDIKGEQAKGVAWRHLYCVRDRLNKLAIVYEALVESGVIE